MLFLWWVFEWPLPSAILSNDAALGSMVPFVYDAGCIRRGCATVEELSLCFMQINLILLYKHNTPEYYPNTNPLHYPNTVSYNGAADEEERERGRERGQQQQASGDSTRERIIADHPEGFWVGCVGCAGWAEGLHRIDRPKVGRTSPKHSNGTRLTVGIGITACSTTLTHSRTPC